MTGESVHLPNGGVYPPLVPVVLRASVAVVDPWTAAKCVAIASVLAVFGAMVVAGRRELGWWPALLAGLAVLFARPMTEPMAFGGYPQNFAVAACLLAVWFQAQLLVHGRRRTFWLAALFTVVAGLSHHMYFMFTFGASGVVMLAWLATVRPPLPTAFARLRLPVVALVAGLVVFAPTYLMLAREGYAPPVNAGDASVADAIRYGFREAEVPWLVAWGLAAIAATAGLGRAFRSRRAPTPLTLTVAAILLPATLAVFATAEARLLPGIALAAPLGAALFLVELDRRVGNVVVRALLAAAPASLLAAMLPAFDRVIEEDIHFYRMLDGDFVAAAQWSQANPPEGAVAMPADSRQWPVGWWFRGLTDAPVLVGSNPKWLAFEQEREEAAFVASLLQPPRSSAEVGALARESGVTRLVVYREYWVGWQRWLREPEPGVHASYGNDTFLVLDFLPP